MAKEKASTISRTNPVEVTDLRLGATIAAAWRGLFHFFGARTESISVIAPDVDAEEDSAEADGGIYFHGLTFDGKFNPEQILSDLASGERNRRVPFVTTYDYLINGNEPPEYTQEETQDMTNWLTSFMKGSEEDGTTKTPLYARNAVSDYKLSVGMRTRRGPRRKILRLEALEGENPLAALEGVSSDYIDRLLAAATAVKAQQNAQSNAKATNSQSNSQVAATS